MPSTSTSSPTLHALIVLILLQSVTTPFHFDWFVRVVSYFGIWNFQPIFSADVLILYTIPPGDGALCVPYLPASLILLIQVGLSQRLSYIALPWTLDPGLYWSCAKDLLLCCHDQSLSSPRNRGWKFAPTFFFVLFLFFYRWHYSTHGWLRARFFFFCAIFIFL